LKFLLVNLLAALNFANVFLNKKRLENSEQFLNGTSAHNRPFQCHVWEIKNVKNVKTFFNAQDKINERHRARAQKRLMMKKAGVR